METRTTSVVRFVIGTLLCSAVLAGCGSSSGSDPDDVEPTATPTPTASVVTGTPRPVQSPSAVTRGARLFFQETFDGNGRTCGTCHPLENGFTLSPEFVASLPASDPLFVAERMPALASLENSALLRGPRALILENVDGFDRPPVFRGVPHAFELARTRPFGWGGRMVTLEELVVQAIRQHFPRTLQRVVGVDFRLPSSEEMIDLVAFLESMTFFAGDTTAFDVMTLARTETERRGAALFFGGASCFACHSIPLLTDNAVVDTGVTRRPINLEPPPECDPPCAALGPLEDGGEGRAFNVPTLLGLASSAPYFHDNSAATIHEAVAHYASDAFNGSQGGGFVGGIHLTDAEIDDIAAFLAGLTICGDGAITAAEECDDGNEERGDGCRPTCTLERCGDGIVDPGERCDDGNADDPDDCTAGCGGEGAVVPGR